MLKFRRRLLLLLVMGVPLVLDSRVHAQSVPDAIAPSFSITIPINRVDQDVWSQLSQRQWLEIGAVALTGVGHLVFRELDASGAYIPLAGAAWGGYIFYRARTEPGWLRELGFSSENLGPAFRDASLLAGGALLLMAGYGAVQGTLDLHPDMLPLMALYPVWGLLQQFLVQGMVAGNLAAADGWFSSPYFITPVTASVFASVHLPNAGLTAGTFALALGYTPIYLEHRNLWPMGLYHGWLGAFYYFWVLDQNPWRELFE